MSKSFTTIELESYLDEGLSPERMAAVEDLLRNEPDLVRELAEINSRRDAGVHSLGGIWRRARLTCPTREQLGSHLLQAVSPELSDYIQFHIETVGCRYCAANLADLESQQADAATASESRRRKYYQSSVGHLRKP